MKNTAIILAKATNKTVPKDQVTTTDLVTMREGVLWLVYLTKNNKFVYGVRVEGNRLREIGEWPFKDASFSSLIRIQNWEFIEGVKE